MAVYTLTGDNCFIDGINLLPSTFFTSENSGWGYPATPTYSEEGATFTTSMQWGSVSNLKKIAYPKGHKMYVYAIIQSNNETAVGIRWWANSSYSTFLNQNLIIGTFTTEQSVSGIWSYEDENVTGWDFSFQMTTANPTTARIKKAIVIDLTDLYGEGNEPTKEWCDKNLTETRMITNIATARVATTMSDVSFANGIFTHLAGKTAMVQNETIRPIFGHKYYGRCYQKAPAGYTYGDGRFEYYSQDVAGIGLMTFGFMEPTDNKWKILSSIQELTGEPVETAWTFRSFTVSGSVDAYRKEILIVDLTETFGAGNEPAKDWCDKNIPFFEGSLIIIPNLKEGDIIDCPYTGAKQGVLLPIGVYNLEAWGAQGGTSAKLTVAGGQGGYSTGLLKAKKPLGLIAYSGGQGSAYTGTTYTSQGGGGFNGGGNAGYQGGGGGGASDFRIGYDSLYARALVAGGGGGSHAKNTTYNAAGGIGGGDIGSQGSSDSASYAGFIGLGASLTAGGAGGTGSSANYNGKAGTFGIGGDTGYKYNNTTYHSNGAGGGGWYGGGAAGNYSGSAHTRSAGGGGGSGYIYTKGLAEYYPEECLLGDNYLETGSSNFWSRGMFSTPQGEINSLNGNQGNGACRITIERLGNTDKSVLLGNNIEQTLNIGNDLIEKAYLGEEQIFPAIEFVDYIEACGHQCIDTEVVMTDTKRIDIDFQLLKNDYGTNVAIVGAFNSTDSTGATFHINSAKNFGFAYGAPIGSGMGQGSNFNRHTAIINYNNSCRIDGSILALGSEMTTSLNSGVNIKILDYDSQTKYPFIKIYSCKIYDNNTLIRNFKPAKTKDGSYGLYDTISKRMFLNEQSGSFYTENILKNVTLESGGISAITDSTPGENLTNTTDVRLQNYIEVEPNTVYSFTRNDGWTVAGASISGFWYDENKKYIGRSIVTSAYESTHTFFYAPYNAKYFRFTDSHNSTTASYTMYKLYQKKMPEYKTELQVTRNVLDTGSFTNVTPTYLTGQMNNSDGFTIVGRSSDASGAFSGNLRWDYIIDLTNYDALSFYCKKGVDHGICAIAIDGIRICYVHYKDLATNYVPYLINLEKYYGIHTVSFIGGYTDSTGAAASETSYCDIKLLKKK